MAFSASPLRTPLCRRLGIDVPIFLAGMGSVATPELAAAVSNAGGLGVIGGTALTGPEVRQLIRRVRELTDRPFGVDVILPERLGNEGKTMRDVLDLVPQAHKDFVAELKQRFNIPEHPQAGTPDDPELRPALGTNFKEQIEVILEERVPVFVSGLGSPGFMVGRAHAQGMVVMSVVGNVRSAKKVVADGVDVVIAQGAEGGAHTSRIGTFALLPQVLDAVSPVPVVAAGGIGDGRGLAAALAFGCQAVWVGTRFIATPESGARAKHKQGIVQADDEATRLTKSYTGKQNRQIYNRWMEAWENGPVEPLPMPLQPALVQPVLRAAGENPDVQIGAAGQIAGLISEIQPAAEIVREMVEQAEQILGSFARTAAAAR